MFCSFQITVLTMPILQLQNNGTVKYSWVNWVNLGAKSSSIKQMTDVGVVQVNNFDVLKAFI